MSEYCYQCCGCGEFKEDCECKSFIDPMAPHREPNKLEEEVVDDGGHADYLFDQMKDDLAEKEYEALDTKVKEQLNQGKTEVSKSHTYADTV